MPIQPSEIRWLRSATVSDSASNGGRMGKTIIPDGVKNNIFPDVPQAERMAGSVKYRKVFIQFANPDNLAAIAPKVFVAAPTTASDTVVIFGGTMSDTQGNLTGNERVYGAGRLQTAVMSGATALEVVAEGAGLGLFQNGDLLRLADSSNEEFVTLAAAPTYNGDLAHLTLTSPLTNTYPTGSVLASCYQPGDVQARCSTPSLNAPLGVSFNHTTYPILVDAIGGVTQSWLLTFISATAFTVAGDTLGGVGSGTINSAFSPNNPDNGRPYFTIDYRAFNGSFVSGNTLSFTTQPAAIPLWYKRIVPAGAASYSGNQVIVGIDCESA